VNHTIKRKTAFIMSSIAKTGIFLILMLHGTSIRAADVPAGPVKRASDARQQGVTLGRMSREAAGIVTKTLRSISHQQEVEAYGTVLQADDLITARRNYADAKAAVGKSGAVLDASRSEYERLKALSDNGNVSEKALDAAKAAWRSDEADASAAAVLLKTIEDSARLRWGRVLSDWVFGDSPEFRRLTDQEDVLVRLTLQPDLHLKTAPPRITLRTPDGTSVHAVFLTGASNTDPHIQGMSFIYLAPSAAKHLLPGMNVMALLPVGRRTRGYMIPFSSVVWYQGRAWVYVQKEAGRFVRREVPTSSPSGGGYFVAGGFIDGDRIVTSGAQVLLSAEFLPKTAGGQEDED
jgi:hypothetical protein